MGRRRLRLRPRRPALRDADRPLRDPGRRGLDDGLALADRPRGRRRGRGVGAVPRRRPRGGLALQRRHRDPRRRRARRCASSAARTSRTRHGSSRPSARRSSTTHRSTGSRSGFGSARGQGAHGDEARGPRLVGEGHRRLPPVSATSTSTTTRRRSTRLRTPSPTSPSAASSRARATSVWRGMIRVDRDAQHTDAFQESRNLLLSPRSHADAIPGLEIEADDVRCTHAAADRPGRRRAALLPPVARPRRGQLEAPRHRRLPPGARQPHDRGPDPRRPRRSARKAPERASSRPPSSPV